MIARFYNIEKIRPSNTKTMYTWIAFDNVVLKRSGVCIRIWIIWIPDVATVLRNCWSTGLVNENATDAKPFPCALQWKFHYWSNMLMKIISRYSKLRFQVLFVNLPCCTSSRCLTRFVPAFCWTITCSISSNVLATTGTKSIRRILSIRSKVTTSFVLK